MMHGHKFRAVWEGSFHLHLVDHFRHAVHDLPPAEQALAPIHQLGHRVPVTDCFEDLGGNQCDSLRVVELKAARQALLGEKTRLMQAQLVKFLRSQSHRGSPLPGPRIVS